MCIILSCEPFARPTTEEITACWENNPDGAGLMYPEDNHVVISKGYQTLKDFLTMVKCVPESAPLVLHFRIGTAGGYGPEVTHPFPVCRDLHTLHALDVECPVGIAHNGVLPYAGDDKKAISDTMEFIRTVCVPLDRDSRVRKEGGLVISPKAKKALSAKSAGSRLAIMDRFGDVRLVGKGWRSMRPGIEASNGTYKPAYRYTTYALPSWHADEAVELPAVISEEVARFMADNGCEACPNYADCAASYPICMEGMADLYGFAPCDVARL